MPKSSDARADETAMEIIRRSAMTIDPCSLSSDSLDKRPAVTKFLPIDNKSSSLV